MRFTIAKQLKLAVYTSILFLASTACAQSWNPVTGVFDGLGEFSASEASNPWLGPDLVTFNGGFLTFLNSAQSSGQTLVQDGTVVTTNGSYSQSNAFQNFRIGGDNGMGRASQLVISDAFNSNVECAEFSLTSASDLDLNSITTGAIFFAREPGTIEVLQNLSVGGATQIEAGKVVNVGGSFNQNNAIQNFRLGGNDGMGTPSALNISNQADSNVECAEFSLTSASDLNLNSITTGAIFFARESGTIDVLQNLSVGGATQIEAGKVVNVGGSFNQNNAIQNFRLGGNDGMGTPSALNISNQADSNVECAEFSLTSASDLNLNSITTGAIFFAREPGTIDVLQNLSVGGATQIEAGKVVNVGGSFNQNNAIQNFRLGGNDGMGTPSALNISNQADSNVECAEFSLTSASDLNLNSITTGAIFFAREPGTIDVLQNLSVGGATQIEAGKVVNVGGSFNQNNAFKNFRLGGNDGMGTPSALNISNQADSDVECAEFSLTSASDLNLNSITTGAIFFAREPGTIDVLQNLSVGGATQIESGRAVIVQGSFCQTDANSNFSISGTSSFRSGSLIIQARQLNIFGELSGQGMITTQTTSALRNGCSVSTGTSLGDLVFDVESNATAEHSLICESNARFDWKIGCDGSDVIRVVGNLQLDNGFEIGISTDETQPKYQAEDQIPVFTYSGMLFASGVGNELTEIEICTESVQKLVGWDVSNVRLVDDGLGTIFLTGLSTFVLGDINNDGDINLLDVQPFVVLLSNNQFEVAADINRDGVVDLLDVAPFVNLLTDN